MKVNGQLELAQLEQIASVSPTPAPTGRIYIDVTNPLAAVPRVWNGTSWRPLTLGQSTATIVQNSAKAVTVNWANGLAQQVTLTDNCTITFQNPVEGGTHTLEIVQNPTTPFVYTLNMPDQDVGRNPYQPAFPLPRNTTRRHSWFYKAGIRAAITTVPVPGPTISAAAIIPSTQYTCITFTPDGRYTWNARASTPFQDWYNNIEVDVQTLLPITLAGSASALGGGTCTGIAISPLNNAVVFATSGTPFIQVNGIRPDAFAAQAAYANPGTLPTGQAFCAVISPRGDFAGVGHATSPFMSIYPIDGQAFGTKLANPSTLPVATGMGLAFSPHGDFITLITTTTPFIQTWAFSTAGVIGAVAANPSILPSGGPSLFGIGKSVAWRPQGDFIAMATGATSPGFYVVPFDRNTGSYGTALTVSGAAIAPGGCYAVTWTPDGQYLLVGCSASPWLLVYDFSTFTLSAPLTYAGANPGTNVLDIAVHPSGDYCYIATNATPFHKIVPLPTKTRNYVRVNF